MERLEQRLQVTKQAIAALDEVLAMPYSSVVRDATIQRFEFTLETLWKLAQLYLNKNEGLDLNSPRSVIRGCFQINFLTEEQTTTLLNAITDRNLTAHTYNEKLAMQIYNNIFKYGPVMKELYTKMAS